jgi:hypothetical protein
MCSYGKLLLAATCVPLGDWDGDLGNLVDQ